MNFISKGCEQLPFIFNSDYSEVRIYKKGNSKWRPIFLDKIKISPYDAMRIKQNPRDKNLLKLVLSPLEEKYSSPEPLSIVGVLENREELTSIDYYNTAQKLLKEDAINKDKVRKFQKDGTLAFVFNSDQTEVRIFRKSGNRNSPIELCAIEKVKPGMKSLQEITDPLEKEYGSHHPERELNRNERNYHYNVGITNRGNFLGEALENFEKAYWAYSKDSHRDETFKNLYKAIDGANSTRQLDHLKMIYNDMKNAKKSPLKRGWGMRKQRKNIERYFKDRELKLLRKQAKRLTSMDKISSFKKRLEENKSVDDM
ncbi:MAG: hypothetical protein GY821_00540 [Gammaproteobacteria bacterium]|nr:hypothetical protein [Gammaproteobacteria bacterium]